jgi:NAD(P)H-hydrate epimerase
MTCQANSSNDLIKIAIDKTVIVFGMGFSSSNWSKELFDFFINYNPAIPKIIDADGLNILATKQSNYNLENTILTPHPKEAATLLATTTKEIQEDRDLAIKKLQQKYQATIVLKGNNSLILGKEQKLYLCPHGNPGMATAGSGDVLSGIIAAIKASNNLDNILAASLAVNIHAKAGDLYAKINGQKGMMATDLIGYISKATNY